MIRQPASIDINTPRSQTDTIHSTYDGDGTLVKSQIDGVVTYSADPYGGAPLRFARRHYHKEVNGENETTRVTQKGIAIIIKEATELYPLAQQHAGNMPCAPDAEWADLLANYVAGNFNNDEYGAARKKWVEKTW